MNNTTDWELIASLEGAYETGSSGAESTDIWYFTLNQTTGAVTGEGIELPHLQLPLVAAVSD